MKAPPASTLVAGWISLSLVATLPVACAEVLGVGSSSEDPIAELCKCDELAEVWPKDHVGSEFYSCREYVEQRFAERPEDVRAWLDTFDERGCESCAKSLDCALAEPLCLAPGEGPCSRDDTCCGYDEAIPTRAYCGYVAVEGSDVIERRCVADESADQCSPPSGICQQSTDCCGSAGGLAQCLGGICIAQCDPDNPILCPDCCALVAGLDEDPEIAYPLCVGSLPYDEAGGPVCNNTCTTTCPFGFGCGVVDYTLLIPIDETGLTQPLPIRVTECVSVIQPN